VRRSFFNYPSDNYKNFLKKFKGEV
jgi:hypothetical protein